MKTREEIIERAKTINTGAPGIAGATRMLVVVVEVLLDIRDLLVESKILG